MNIVAIHSGGMDSTVMLHYLRHNGHEIVEALNFDYGQKHGPREMQASELTCAALGVTRRVIDVGFVRDLLADSGSALLSDAPAPEGHYEDESMKQTVVPNRNMVLLSVAVSRAIAVGADAVAYGAHGTDRAIYPDCRSEFVDAMQAAVALCDWSPPRVMVPFVAKQKSDIARIGADLGVDFAKTWSCYNGRELHCGKCGTCQERIEAFQIARVPDPVRYE